MVSGMTGKLGRAWVGAWVGVWVYGDVVLGDHKMLGDFNIVLEEKPLR